MSQKAQPLSADFDAPLFAVVLVGFVLVPLLSKGRKIGLDKRG